MLTHESIAEGSKLTAEDIPRLSDLSPRDIDDWSTGTEKYAKTEPSDLLVAIGIDPKSWRARDSAVPWFCRKYDPSEIRRNPTDHPQWFEVAENGAPLEPRPHQFCGMLRILENIFEGEPVAVFDEVGLGKTIQAIGVICLLTYYREWYKMKGDFPGIFGMLHFS